MKTHERNVTIIIPTLASRARATSLLGAIRSVTSEQEIPAVPIVVANGTRFNPDLVDQLKSDRSLRYFYLEESGLSRALNFARKQVDTEFFGFLDDDDYYYPWAIRERLDTLEADPTADVAVSWGERETPDGLRRSPAAEELDVNDPLCSLMRSNWLTSCGGMFRAANISSEYFDPTVPSLEWTYVAFRLALERKIRFVVTDRPHYFVANTPGSASKSLDYVHGVRVVLEKMAAWPLPPDLRQALTAKRIANLHKLAEQHRIEGKLASAWGFHLKSLVHPKGLKYLLSTRRYVAATGRSIVWPAIPDVLGGAKKRTPRSLKARPR